MRKQSAGLLAEIASETVLKGGADLCEEKDTFSPLLLR
jgi:hypothetical protein